MTEPMTEKDLAAIEARAEAASSGPWYKEKGGICGFAGQTYRVNVQFTDRGGMNEDNADFIVAARADVPRLLAEVRRLRMQGLADFDNLACETNLRQEAEAKLLSMTLKVDELRKMLEDANQREEQQIQLLKKTAAIVHLVAEKRACCIPPCDGISGRLCEVHQAIADLAEPRPIPMCKPDPLEDLFPRAEGSPT